MSRANPPMRRALPYAAWSIVSGLTIAVAIPPYAVPGLAFLCLVPFFAFLYLPMRSERQRFFYGWLAGLIALAPSFGWSFEAAPLSWLGLSSYAASYAAAAFGIGILVTFFALAFGAFAVLGRALRRDTPLDAVSFAALWALLEFTRTWAYSFHPLAFGRGLITGDHMGFGILGFAFAALPLVRPWAAIVGSYGLSFIAAFVSGLITVSLWNIYRIPPGERAPRAIARTAMLGALAAAVALAAIFGGGALLQEAFSRPAGSIRVAVPQTGMRLEDFLDLGRRRALEDAVRDLISGLVPTSDADVVLVPEGVSVFPEAYRRAPDAAEVRRLVGDRRDRIILSDIAAPPTVPVEKNSVGIYDTRTGLLGTYEKRFLLPYGEYMPTLIGHGLKAVGLGRMVNRERQFRPGETPSVYRAPAGAFGIRICSEILSPQLISDSVQDGAETLFFSSSIALLRGSPIYHAEARSMAQVWAAATRRSILYAATNEPAFLVDPRGAISWEAPDDRLRIHLLSVPLENGRTPYSRHPRGFLAASTIYLIILSLASRSPRSPELPKK